ncbi:MAG: DUF6934 family protein [Cyclobacteriaceae bacterium]
MRFNKLNSVNSGEVYNLGFGDFDEEKDGIDDLVISNNKDSQKILATVAAAVVSFTDLYPEVQVFATGSTPARTRFYVLGVSKNLKEITELFELWALNEKEWELFRENRPYLALLAKRK